MTTFRIALANLPYPSTPAEAVSLAEQAIAQAATEGAALACFPECFIPGYRAPGKPVPPHDPAFMERAWAARRGAQVVFHPHFGEAEPGAYRPTTFMDPANTFHEKAIACRAAENTCFVASVNCAGEGSPTTSAVASPDGTVLAWQPYGKAGLLVVDLDLDEATGSLARRCRMA